MIDALYISVWAYLFTGPLSEPGQVFAPVKSGVTRLLTAGGRPLDGWREWLYNPLVGCAKCHAGQIAFWWQVSTGFDIQPVLIAVFAAHILTKIEWLN